MSYINVKRVGTSEIVSSGYSDRFVMSTSKTVIERDGIHFTVENNDAAIALVMLSGGDIHSYEEVLAASERIGKSELVFFGFCKKGSVSTTTTVRASVVNAGIKIVSGFPNLSEVGVEMAKKDVLGITEHEINFIEYWLSKINKEHRETGRPVVEFDIETIK